MIVIETKYSKRDNTLKIYYHSLVFKDNSLQRIVFHQDIHY